MMKKTLALLLMVVMSFTLLTGCGSDPVFDDLEKFLNTDMVEVNAEYELVKEEISKWSSFEEDAQIKQSIQEVLLPLINGSLEKLENINPATEEVKALKAKYVGVMEAYKVAFELLAEGCDTQDDATIDAGNAKLEEALALLDDYNTSMEALAAEHGGEVEY